MFQPPGFNQFSLTTAAGLIAYYAPEPLGNEASQEGDNGNPTLVFLHGFGGGSSAYEWSQIYPTFADEYRLLVPDLIGWGRSEHLAREYRVEDYLTAIAEFLEKTCDRPATVVASSLTAGIVVRLAIARPELFKALILATPAGLSDFGEDYSRSFFAQMVSTPVLDRVLYQTAIATEWGIRGFLEKRQFANPARIYPELIEAYLKSAQQPNAEYSALSFVRGDLCFDLSLYMNQLATPTAIFWGEKAQYTKSDIGRRLAEMNPQAVKAFEVVPDTGLTPHLELPAVTIRLIRRFLKTLSAEA